MEVDKQLNNVIEDDKSDKMVVDTEDKMQSIVI